MTQPPYPGPPQQPWGQWQGPPPGWQPPPAPPLKPRFGWGARIGMVVLGLFVLGSLSRACTGDTQVGDTAQQRTPAVSSTPPRPAQPVQPVGPPPFAGAQTGDLATTPGGVLTADGVTVTATELREGDSTFGQTLCSTVTYRNDSGESARFGPFDWEMQNPSGASVSITFFAGADTQLSTGELAPGGTVTGDVCFEDENASPGDYLVIYEAPGLFTDQRLAWINPR